jgi:delta24(24(1))-sterol reductase
MRGEEGIPVTWDIFYEKWGWMLIFWNLAGVPFTYCYQSIYLASRPPFEHSTPYTAAVFALLLAGYYVWDVSNSQRCYFRMQQEGTFRYRLGLYLPWLPGRFIKVRAHRDARRLLACGRAGCGDVRSGRGANPRGRPHLPPLRTRSPCREQNPQYIQTEHGSKLLVSGWWGVARKVNYTADIAMVGCHRSRPHGTPSIRHPARVRPPTPRDDWTDALARLVCSPCPSVRS